MVLHQENIWVAAGDGDLVRVRDLIEQHGLSANVPDPHTYTPLHAAASYSQLDMLDYLITQGGDVNVTDADGDTPLYVVEDVQTAQWLVQHGAIVDRRNNEGITPIDTLEEEFPAVAAYLRTVLNPDDAENVPQSHHAHPSQHSQNIASESLTSSLMDTVHNIMERAERDGTDPDEELRTAVSRTILDGVATGYEMSEANNETRREESPPSAKRPRTNGSLPE